ncbi:P-loop containing nucleoside triphosphate hydrolase protein [Phellopilus nigrolimitatus]|nr:P-loop containing nucleoside triphosphate hydrolase protein [Phellopilus nigrolimitatus]
MPAFQDLIQVGQKRPYDASGHVFESRKRQSLGAARGDSDLSAIANDPTKVGEQYWMVQWRAPQYRKHKTWDGDGVLVLSGGKGTLYGMEGNILTQGKPNPDGACAGTLVFLGGREMEIDCALSKEDFTSGKVFGRRSFGASPIEEVRPSHASSSTLTKKFVPLTVSTNALRQQPQYPGGSDATRRREIDLQPVGLLQQEEKPAYKALSSDPTTYWSAHWRKPQGKKHKTWDGDSFVICSERTLTMISDEGRKMGSIKWDKLPLHEGYRMRIGAKEVELEGQVSPLVIPGIIGGMSPDDDADMEMAVYGDYSEEAMLKPAPMSFAAKENSGALGDAYTSAVSTNSDSAHKKFVAPVSFYGKPVQEQAKASEPLHSPNSEGAVVMKEPTKEHQKKFNLKNRPMVPVVIDPILTRHLRPHQKEGVKFMYECVMGLGKHEGQGCILADEMGMGKTLQTISLVWTLLKQNAYAGGGPALGKVLIVCPVTLITNWKKEFHKWLGKDRVGVFTGDKDKSVIKQFINTKKHHVLVIGYERLRSVISDLSYCMPPIGLIICDEGHRLKSANNKTSKMFEALRTPRRIILSGTPIQNDLSEFHAMSDFCNPGLLDDYSTFRRVFETPILKSRAPGCSAKELEIGEARHAQLQAVAKSFVLRRDAGILSNYLPPKHEYVVFVTPSSLQKAMFTKILQPDALSSLLRGSVARSLAMIQLLTKLSNSPILLKAALEKRKSKSTEDDLDGKEPFEDAMKLLPNTALPEDVNLSGKLCALSQILRYIRKDTEEKCVLVSHYTSTLNVIEAFCKNKKYTYLRLDGQTPVTKRQEYVDSFNKAPQSSIFIFLLSAKAGGVGLNLIGASRLMLIDSDWNPSHDLQAMARIHRDGQKRPVFIYRLLTAGTIDEKIYQRQVTKLGLSESLMGKDNSDDVGKSKSKSDSFTHKELRDLFTFHHQTACHTHELLGCPCAFRKDDGLSQDSGLSRSDGGLLDDSKTDSAEEDDEDVGQPQELGFRKASLHKPEELAKMDKAFTKKKRAELASLGEWTHINCLDTSAQASILDEALQAISYRASTDESDPFQSDLCSNSPHADEGQISADRVPGGTVCFLFEKVSKSSV